MAVSQTLTLTEVSGSVNNSANTSKVRILWKSTQTGESWNGYTRTAKYYVSINGGAETEYSVSYTLPQSATKTIVDVTLTITHKSDGTGSVKVRTWMDTDISAGVIEKSRSLTLTTIPRASTIDSLSCATKYFNGKLTYKYTPKSSSYYNRCNISIRIDGESIAVKSVLLGKKSASQQTATVTFSEDELSIIYNELPKTTKGTLRFTFRTYSDSGYSTQIGDYDYEEITLYIPNISATQPTATMTLSPVTSLASPFNTLYIKGRTKVDANFTDGEGKYGASIVSYKMSVEGKSYGSPYTSGYLSTTGSITVSGTVTDSRGYSRTYKQTITVISYGSPTLLPASDESTIICARCDSSGNLTESGTYLKIKARRSYYKVSSDGVQNNFCAIRYRCVPEGTKFSGDEGWVPLLASSTTSTNTVNKTLSGVVSSTETAYVVQVGVIDDMGESDVVQFIIPTDFVTIDIPEDHKGRRMGIFRYAQETEEDGVYVGLPIFGGSVDSLKLGTSLVATEAAPIDLNDVKTPGCYYSPGADYSQYIVNSPYTAGGFALEVRELQSKNYIRQTLFFGRTTLIRHWNSTEWSNWLRYMVTSMESGVSSDFVAESGTFDTGIGTWYYKKWENGTYQMFGYFDVTPTESTLNASVYRTNSISIPSPFNISSACVSGSVMGHCWISNGGITSEHDAVALRILSDEALSTTSSVNVRLTVMGVYE